MRTSALPGSSGVAARRIAVRTASPPPSRRRSSRRGGNTRAGVPASCSYGSPTAARGLELPAASTAGDLLHRRGLVRRRRRRRAWKHPGAPELVTAGPNDVWTADFKGHFRTGDGAYCYPLTVADQHSRYLLACDALASIRT